MSIEKYRIDLNGNSEYGYFLSLEGFATGEKTGRKTGIKGQEGTKIV